jgi:hypothetical protein
MSDFRRDDVVVRMIADREIAERALNKLRSLRAADRATVLKDLPVLKQEVANTVPDYERADAWLVVSALLQHLHENSGEATTLWNDAIAKTEVWARSFH